jgi:hypothetical protein
MGPLFSGTRVAPVARRAASRRARARQRQRLARARRPFCRARPRTPPSARRRTNFHLEPNPSFDHALTVVRSPCRRRGTRPEDGAPAAAPAERRHTHALNFGRSQRPCARARGGRARPGRDGSPPTPGRPAPPRPRQGPAARPARLHLGTPAGPRAAARPPLHPSCPRPPRPTPEPSPPARGAPGAHLCIPPAAHVQSSPFDCRWPLGHAPHPHSFEGDAPPTRPPGGRGPRRHPPPPPPSTPPPQGYPALPNYTSIHSPHPPFPSDPPPPLLWRGPQPLTPYSTG